MTDKQDSMWRASRGAFLLVEYIVQADVAEILSVKLLSVKLGPLMKFG